VDHHEANSPERRPLSRVFNNCAAIALMVMAAVDRRQAQAALMPLTHDFAGSLVALWISAARA